MSEDTDHSQTPAAGLSASVKVIAIIGITLVAGMAILFALDVISFDAFSNASGKVVILTGVAVIASMAIARFARSDK